MSARIRGGSGRRQLDGGRSKVYLIGQNLLFLFRNLKPVFRVVGFGLAGGRGRPCWLPLDWIPGAGRNCCCWSRSHPRALLVFGSLLCCRQIHVYLAACAGVHTLAKVVRGFFNVFLGRAPQPPLSISLSLSHTLEFEDTSNLKLPKCKWWLPYMAHRQSLILIKCCGVPYFLQFSLFVKKIIYRLFL